MSEQIIEIFGNKYKVIEESETYTFPHSGCDQCDLAVECDACVDIGRNMICLDTKKDCNRHFELIT